MRETVCYLDSEGTLLRVLETERMKPEYIERWRSPSLYTFLEKHCNISKGSWLLVERTWVISPILMKKLLDNKNIKEAMKQEKIVAEADGWLF